MQYKVETVEEYLQQIPEERQEVMKKLHNLIKENLPEGFEAAVGYGMIGFVVPHSIYPSGYHCDPKQPLPFMGIASQKNFISLYNMGIYADKDLYDWFTSEYGKYVKTKLDMGKSCIRFKKIDNIPFQLIAELCQKLSVADWIALYEKNYLKSK